MATLDQFVRGLIGLLVGFADIVLRVLDSIEISLTQSMRQAGLGPDLQAVILVVVAVLFLVAVIRLLGGFLRVVVLLLLISLAAHYIYAAMSRGSLIRPL